MSESNHDATKTSLPTSRAVAPPPPAMEEEEKILAGRDDVNMPALLTRDVHGG